MRGYGRDYGNRDYRNDREGWLSGGSGISRDRMRHNPSWEDREYGNRGFRGSQGGDWRSRTYEAGRGYGRDYNDYGRGDYTYGDFGRQQPRVNRGYDRGMRGGAQNRSRGRGDRPYGDADTDFGMGGGLGTYRPGGSFSNPTSRGDFFLGYGGGSSRGGYTPYW
jgi:hypothetical protein